jgi:23S rRNA (pseudouridine1915-N3)-methyltransferase
MNIRLIWPGKTKSAPLRELQEFYLRKIREFVACEIVETPAARGIDERFGQKILEIEARGLEKRLKDDYIVCLFDEGQRMSSREFAKFFERRAADGTRTIAFVAGGFLGLAPRILSRAQTCLSLSRMTLSHELCRAVLMEQIYRSLSLMQGRPYAK